MTEHDAFSANLASVLDDQAQAPIPADGIERLEAAIANRRPRPARLARLGSRWVDDASAATASLGALRAPAGIRRLSATALLLLLTLALIGTAALIGSSLLDRPPGPEKLLYELGGDIFLADEDGRNPISVAEGALLLEGSPWAPDGRHFLSFDSPRLRADIRQPDGRVVASFPNLPGFSGYPVWSPDSTHLQAWAQSFRQINIYGIDGALQAELPLPEGYTRLYEYLGTWAPDGRSVWVLIRQDQSFPCTEPNSGAATGLDAPTCAAKELWELPIDGSAPQHVTLGGGVSLGPVSFTRDGTRMAIPMGAPGQVALHVTNADGTDPRPVGVGMEPVWSPGGEQLAYFASAPGDGMFDLKVVDVATGTDRTLVAGMHLAAPTWSRDGDTLLYRWQDAPGPGLWTVGADGGEPTLLVAGATHGQWQPAPTTAPPGLILAPTPTPPPKADYAAHMVAALDELQRAWTADDVNTTFHLLGIEAAWVMDRLPGNWMDDPARRDDDPAIAAYVDAVHVLVGVLPDTPAWDEAWTRYFATRPALAALVPGRMPTAAP